MSQLIPSVAIFNFEEKIKIINSYSTFKKSINFHVVSQDLCQKMILKVKQSCDPPFWDINSKICTNNLTYLKKIDSIISEFKENLRKL